MIDKERRIYLKQIGTAATLTAIAGCLDGGDSSGAPTDNGSSTPTSGQETEGQPDGDQPETEREESDQTNSNSSPSVPEVLNFVPTSDELNMSDYDGTGSVQLVALGFPSDVVEVIPEEAQGNYEENGSFVPYDFADVSMSQVDSKAAIRFEGIGVVPIYQFEEDIGENLNDDIEDIGEYGEFDVLYLQDAEQPFSDNTTDTMILYNGRTALHLDVPGNERQYQETLERMVDASNEGASRMVENTELGQAISDIDYQDVTQVGTQRIESDLVAAGSRFNFSDSGYELQRIELDGEGDINVTETNNFGLDQYSSQI
jgi:hypothetical protein